MGAWTDKKEGMVRKKKPLSLSVGIRHLYHAYVPKRIQKRQYEYLLTVVSKESVLY